MTASPLSGIRVVVTRPRRQAAALVDALESVGATAVSIPVIDIADPADGGKALQAALRSLGSGDWLVFTSPNGASRVDRADVSAGVRIACIGPGTEARAEALGFAVDLVPERSIAEGILEVFPAPPASGGRVVLARAESARSVLPDELRTAGWRVDDVASYRTIAVAIDDADRDACRDADAVAFTSGSTVTHLLDQVGVDGLPPVVAAIGPATAEMAADRGVEVTIEAAIHTIPGLTEALVGYFDNRVVIHTEDAASTDAQWCLEQYFADIGDRFETGLDRGAVLTSDPQEVSPPNGLFVVARLDGQAVGCGCLKLVAPDVADIKRMWLDPSVRGRGLGRGILDRLVAEGRRLEVRRVQLETNEALIEAIALYRAAGFVEVKPFNDEPHAHHWFALDLD
jgi:uroporphyrinogen-III synthase/ribosomal protein S18 acetylase RimI-like enzyme